MAYAVGEFPDDMARDVREFLRQELEAIASDLTNGPEALKLRKLFVAPPKPRDGMVVLADGTQWNPGSGAGFYGYNAGSWVFLG